jgi:hypothetical protein
MADTIKKSSPLLIAVAWAVVILPTAWGLKYTLQSAMKIFVSSAPSTTAPPKQ